MSKKCSHGSWNLRRTQWASDFFVQCIYALCGCRHLKHYHHLTGRLNVVKFVVCTFRQREHLPGLRGSILTSAVTSSDVHDTVKTRQPDAVTIIIQNKQPGVRLEFRHVTRACTQIYQPWLRHACGSAARVFGPGAPTGNK